MRRVLVAAAAKISSVVTAVVHAADVLIVSLGALCNRSVTAVLYPANAWLIISILSLDPFRMLPTNGLNKSFPFTLDP